MAITGGFDNDDLKDALLAQWPGWAQAILEQNPLGARCRYVYLRLPPGQWLQIWTDSNNFFRARMGDNAKSFAANGATPAAACTALAKQMGGTPMTTIDRRTAKTELTEAFPTFKSEGQDEHWFFNEEDNKFFGLMGDGIAVEFCAYQTLGVFIGKLEILNPDYGHSDPEEDDDIEPWLAICKGDPHSTLAEAIASLKEAISSHAKAIAFVHSVELPC